MVYMKWRWKLISTAIFVFMRSEQGGRRREKAKDDKTFFYREEHEETRRKAKIFENRD